MFCFAVGYDEYMMMMLIPCYCLFCLVDWLILLDVNIATLLCFAGFDFSLMIFEHDTQCPAVS